MVNAFNQLYITNKMERFSFKKWACPAGCEAYKRRLAYTVTVRISAQKQLYILLKG